MDLSFALIKPEGIAHVAVTMADIRVAARKRQDLIPAFRGLCAILRGQDAGADPVHALARLAVSGICGPIEAADLSGSFHPQVARQLMVGKRR